MASPCCTKSCEKHRHWVHSAVRGNKDIMKIRGVRDPAPVNLPQKLQLIARKYNSVLHHFYQII